MGHTSGVAHRRARSMHVSRANSRSNFCMKAWLCKGETWVQYSAIGHDAKRQVSLNIKIVFAAENRNWYGYRLNEGIQMPPAKENVSSD